MEFYFVCEKCEIESEALGLAHTRLLSGQVWVCSKCKPQYLLDNMSREVRDLANGSIIEEADF